MEWAVARCAMTRRNMERAVARCDMTSRNMERAVARCEERQTVGKVKCVILFHIAKIHTH